METRIDNLTIPSLRKQVRLNDSNYVGEDLLLVMDNHELGRTWFQIGQPYRLGENIFIRVMEGIAIYNVNLTRYELHPGDILIFPADALLVIEWVTDDLHIQIMTFRDLPLTRPLVECRRYHPDDNDWGRVGFYMELMWKVVHEQGFSLTVIRHLQAALLEDLDSTAPTGRSTVPLTRSEETFDRFLALVNRYGARQRNIAFYADKLFITANRLSTIIKQTSGLTVMQWLSRATIMQAKILLKNSDLRMYEIADRLQFANASFFSKFFRRETGMTPRAYRES